MSESIGESQGSSANGKTSTSAKSEATVAALERLLKATPAAEELTQTWLPARNKSVQRREPRLQDLRRFFDAGRSIGWGEERKPRGVPMWIVVRMCKATWHQDGTWPLLGADEEAPEGTPTASLVRSIHASADVLRPHGTTHFQWPTGDEHSGPPPRPEQTGEEIAHSYRSRGVHVAEADLVADNDW